MVFNFIILIVLALLGVVFRFKLDAIIGHSIGAESYGDFKVTITIVMFIGQILIIGLDGVASKYIPNMMMNNKQSQAKFLILSLFKILLLILVVWGIISFFLKFLFFKLSHNIILSGYIHPSMYFLGYASIFGLFFWVIRVIRASGYVNTSFLLFNAPVILFFIIIPKNLDLNKVLLLSASCTSFVCLITLILILYVFRKLKNTKFSVTDMIRSDAINYTIQNILAFSPISILLILTEIMPVNEAKVGILSLLVTISGFFTIASTITRAYFLNLASTHINSSKVVIKKILVQIYITSAITFLICALIVYSFISHEIYRFGSEYAIASKLIFIVFLANIPASIMTGDMIFIKMSKLNKYFNMLFVIKIVITFILGLIFINYWNIYGAIYAFLIEEIICGIIVLYIKSLYIQQIEST